MKSIIKITLFFCFSILSPNGFTQSLEQLERLQAIGEGFAGQEDSDSDNSESKDQNNQIKNQEGVLDDLLDFEDDAKDFGYTGGEDFLIAPSPKNKKDELKYFGYNYFKNNQYAQISDIPIPSNYILGPGDEVKLILYGNISKKYNLEVNRDGDIFFPEIGPVFVAGLTFKDVRETLEKIISNQLIGTEISVTLGSLKSINIFVLGEATKPGMYTVNALSNLTNAIFLSGGIKTTGSLRNIQLKRDGKIVSNFDFYQLLLNGDTSNDSNLMAGDVVFIPPITKKVAITGEIERPGVYELLENESAEDLIRFAGTLTEKADLRAVEIERIDPMGKGFNLVDIDLQKTSFSDLLLNDGDALSIQPVISRLNQAILLKGHARQPGYHPWRQGMTIQDLLSSKEDLLPNTDINYALIKREKGIQQEYEILQVNLEDLLTSENSKQNLALKERDEIIFFPSQLNIDLIETIEIKESLDDEMRLFGPVYANKSLSNITNKEVIEDDDIEDANLSFLDKNPIDEIQSIDDESLDTGIDKKYYTYMVYDYCEMTKDEIESVLIDEEGDDEIDLEIELSEAQQGKNQNYLLTSICRDKLIRPVVEILDSQSSNDELKQIIEVYGNVNYPGSYPLALNANLKDVLYSAGGIKDLSYVDEIEITRKTVRGKEVVGSNFTVDLDSIEEKILPLDIVTIKKYSEEINLVQLDGEVFFPGVYPVSKDETLLELIQRAGGLTEKANTKAIFFSRQSLAKQELKRLQTAKEELRKRILLAQEQQPTNTGTDDQFLNRIVLLTEGSEPDSEALGRLVIDYELIKSGQEKDVQLKNNDRIIIPRSQQTVSIIGEVFAPNSHFFDSSKSIENYLALSGGLTEFADNDNIYIIKGNGSVVPISQASSAGFFRGQSNAIEAGDTIVVPIEIRTGYGIRAASEVTEIIYQLALAGAAINSFSN